MTAPSAGYSVIQVNVSLRTHLVIPGSSAKAHVWALFIHISGVCNINCSSMADSVSHSTTINESRQSEIAAIICLVTSVGNMSLHWLSSKKPPCEEEFRPGTDVLGKVLRLLRPSSKLHPSQELRPSWLIKETSITCRTPPARPYSCRNFHLIAHVLSIRKQKLSAHTVLDWFSAQNRQRCGILSATGTKLPRIIFTSVIPLWLLRMLAEIFSHAHHCHQRFPMYLTNTDSNRRYQYLIQRLQCNLHPSSQNQFISKELFRQSNGKENNRRNPLAHKPLTKWPVPRVLSALLAIIILLITKHLERPTREADKAGYYDARSHTKDKVKDSSPLPEKELRKCNCYLP